MKPILPALVVLASLSGAATARPGQAHAAKTAAHGHGPAKKAALVCPVTGDKIASVKAAVGHSTYKGKTYYFCCPDCKPKFVKNPAKYVRNAAKGKFDKM